MNLLLLGNSKLLINLNYILSQEDTPRAISEDELKFIGFFYEHKLNSLMIYDSDLLLGDMFQKLDWN